MVSSYEKGKVCYETCQTHKIQVLLRQARRKDNLMRWKYGKKELFNTTDFYNTVEQPICNLPSAQFYNDYCFMTNFMQR